MKLIRSCLAVGLLSLLTISCSDDTGIVTPQIRIISASPNQVTSGQRDVEIEIAGSGFVTVSGVSCGNDISVRNFQVIDSSLIRIHIDVDSTASPGSRTITVLTPSGSAHLDAGLQIVQNRPPKASFTVEPLSGSQGTVFTFDARGSDDTDGRIKSYLWEFGDGTTSTKSIAKHQFAQTGKHTVTLTVIDNVSQEDSKQGSVKVTFDLNVARQQIDAVCKEFLRLFGQLETLSADEIVVGFSEAGACPGRQREIEIITRHQSEGGFVDVNIFSPTEVPHVDEQIATAILSANFSGRQGNGISFNGVATHIFEMKNEAGGWKICDFQVNEH